VRIENRRFFLLGGAALVASGAAGLALRGFRPLPGGGVPAAPDSVHEDERIDTETRLLMGTFVTVTLRHPSPLLRQEAMQRAFAEISRLEGILTRHRADAPLAVLNAQGSLRDTPPELYALLAESLRECRRTGAAFNPASLPLLAAVRGRGLASPRELPEAERRELWRLADPSRIVLEGRGRVRLAARGTAISLDGIAKGSIADHASRVLRDCGVENHLVNAGGDILASGLRAPGRPWRVGIQAAGDPGKVSLVAELRDMALATSGNSVSLGRDGCEHIIPVRGNNELPMFSVSAIAPTARRADALSTALFAMAAAEGKFWLAKRPEYGAAWQDGNGGLSTAGARKLWAPRA
jgi:thiamine biosynthesis lipoprotein